MSDVLIVGDSVRNPMIRHEVSVTVPDPFLYAEHGDRRIAVVGSFEVQRVQAAGAGLEVYAFERFGRDELQKQGLNYDEVIVRVCDEVGVRDAVVPPDFPLEVADRLRESGVEVRWDRPFFDGRRRVKNEAEIAGIRRAQRAAEAGMDAARDLLRRVQAANGTLKVDGEPLTSERVKQAIHQSFIASGCTADEFIVSHGAQSAVGHEMGFGEIKAGEPLVIDVWPKDPETACYADMTRTFCVGDVPDELREYHWLVKESLDRSLADIRAGANGRHVFDVACAVFERHGYATLRTMEVGAVLEDGFFHSLGHGVGLEVHEEPSLGKVGDELVAGDVVTVEPGLYRQGFGGCRLEDLVLVTPEGAENLTQYPYDLAP